MVNSASVIQFRCHKNKPSNSGVTFCPWFVLVPSPRHVEPSVCEAADMSSPVPVHVQLLLLLHAPFLSHRYTIKGIRNLIFYELPTYPHFYSEVCNMLRATSRGEEATWTCTVLYSKYDAQRLAAVVGVERAAVMLQSPKNVHLFVTGEK